MGRLKGRGPTGAGLTGHKGGKGALRKGHMGTAVGSVPREALGTPSKSGGLGPWSFSSETKLQVEGEGRASERREERRRGKERGRGREKGSEQRKEAGGGDRGGRRKDETRERAGERPSGQSVLSEVLGAIALTSASKGSPPLFL